MRQHRIVRAGLALMAAVLGASFVAAQMPEVGEGEHLFWVAAPPPAAVATVDSHKMLQDMGNRSYEVRVKASEDLQAALLGGKLTMAQIQEIRQVINGQGLGTDLEIRRRAERIFGIYVRRLDESSPFFKVEITFDGNTTMHYKLGPFTGLLNKNNAQEVKDFNKLQELAQAALNELLSGDTVKAKAKLEELKAFLQNLPANRYDGLGLYKGGGVKLPQQEAVGSIQTAIDKLPATAGRIQQGAGPKPAGDRPKAPVRKPAGGGLGAAPMSTGLSFRLVLDTVEEEGEVDFTLSPEPASARVVATGSFEIVGPVYDLLPEGGVEISGEVQVGIEYGSSGTPGQPIPDPGELQIVRVANGEIQFLPTALNDLGGGVIWATYLPEGDGLDPFGAFLLVQPAGAPSPPPLTPTPTTPTPPTFWP